ncbi:Peptidyl-tRNA hydrolase [Termitomyces sp. T112]|nr:Peptidyl-tRNA hydrolase [Termitomyces sp. T112]KAH0589531.1 hypothetical protein H2248_005268 [Termitomyces sp. 'cryptogamus']
MPVSLPRILIVGLGNLPLPLTRHSVGQLIIDSLATRLDITLSADRSGFAGHGTVIIGETMVSLHLFKSKSLMNVSGPSIAAVCRKTVQSPKSMIVISDSLSHKVETMHTRLGGSANGHNGVKSIISALGNDMNFHRFRIGIGRDDTDAATYVMNKLSSHERHFWANEGLDLLLSGIEKVALQN